MSLEDFRRRLRTIMASLGVRGVLLLAAVAVMSSLWNDTAAVFGAVLLAVLALGVLETKLYLNERINHYVALWMAGRLPRNTDG